MSIRSRRSAKPPSPHAIGVEPLESRTLLTAFSWTPQEVYLSELVNRARANPLAEGVRLGLDLSLGLSAAEQARLVRQEPLALSPALTLAARAHSADMALRNFFSHTNPDGLDPTARARAAGYPGSAGENIAAGYPDIDAAHRAWLLSIGHRRNVLSLWTTFTSTFHYDEFGPGLALGAGGQYNDYYTQLFGARTAATAPTTALLGVVYADTNNNDFYTIGEGRANVRVDVVNASGTAVGSYTTDAAGNYQLNIVSGDYTVRFTDLSNARTWSQSVTIATENLKLDADPRDFLTPPPPPPPDDHASAGDWASATPITVNTTTGDAAAGGTIEVSTDTDLFTFTAAKPGVTTISLSDGSPSALTLRVYGANRTLLASGSSVQFTLAQGQTYYVLIAGNSGLTPGTDYTFSIDAPDDAPPPPPSPGTNPLIVPRERSPEFTLALPSGRIASIFINSSGSPVVAQRSPAGVWSWTDLTAAIGGTGEVLTLTAWNSGARISVAAATSGGLLLYELTKPALGLWTLRNLSAELPASTPIISGLNVLAPGKAGRGAILTGLTQFGDAVVFEASTLLTPGSVSRWTFNNASATLRARGVVPPRLSSPLLPIVNPGAGLSLVATDLAGKVRLLTRVRTPAGGSNWLVANLSTITRSPALSGGISTLTTGTGPSVATSQRIAGLTAAGKLWVLSFRPGSGWFSTNLSAALPASITFTSAGLTSFVSSAGVGFITGLTTDARTLLFRFNPITARWSAANLTASVNAPTFSRITSALVLPSGILSLTGLTGDNTLLRTWGAPALTTPWSTQPLG